MCGLRHGAERKMACDCVVKKLLSEHIDMREVNEGSTTMLRVLNTVILRANSLVAGKKKESDPVSSPLNTKAGTFSYTGYLYSMCRHLHSNKEW